MKFKIQTKWNWVIMEYQTSEEVRENSKIIKTFRLSRGIRRKFINYGKWGWGLWLQSRKVQANSLINKCLEFEKAFYKYIWKISKILSN